jgi:hypothetical protein
VKNEKFQQDDAGEPFKPRKKEKKSTLPDMDDGW